VGGLRAAHQPQGANDMKTYTAWAIDVGNDKVQYDNLSKGRALWRYHWFGRMNQRMRLKEWGWRAEP
jgi:hypothetical protein